jgi:hypothetical protein
MSLNIEDHVSESLIRAALRLPDNNTDNRVLLVLDWDGSDFRDQWCDIQHGHPAVVMVDYNRNAGDEIEDDWVALRGCYSWPVAADAIAAILDDERVSDGDYITVSVNTWYFVYSNNALLELATHVKTVEDADLLVRWAATRPAA